MPTLLAVKGINLGIKYRLGQLTRIGRAPDNDIQLADQGVSRLHCEIRRQGRAYTICDLSSRNGVLVNGQRVSEKLLLRNDEVAIGAAVFLFNSDYDLRSVRFSNKMAYFSPPQDETIPLAAMVEAGAPPASRMPAAALESLSALFDSAEESFPETLQKTLNTLVDLFRAEQGCLLLWDEALQELTPMVAVGEGEELALSQQILKTAFYEKRAILTSDVDLDRRYSSMAAGPAARPLSTMCVPLLAGETAIGALYLERLRLDHYTLEDIRFLRSAANLAATAVDRARIGSGRRPATTEGGESGSAPLGKSAAFLKVLLHVEKAAPQEAAVLLVGETGTGKEVIAREIHRRGPRANGPFVPVNCSAIPEGLFETELFGHERGAFTGADRLTLGKIESAHGGTLFLDEVGELAANVQPKLLRFLQDKVFYRVGGNKPISVDIRLIAATNRDLAEAIAQKAFREDLFYRLDVFRIDLPPLRERREDIRLLAERFAPRAAARLNKPFFGFTAEAMMALEKHPWPGNIRELENCIERAVLLSDSGVIGPGLLPFASAAPGGAGEGAGLPRKKKPESLSLRDIEKRAIADALARCGCNQVKAADLLQIHRNTLRKKIEEYEIDLDDLGR